jgi:hypothetical protein
LEAVGSFGFAAEERRGRGGGGIMNELHLRPDIGDAVEVLRGGKVGTKENG